MIPSVATPTISGTTLPSGQVGSPYSAALSASSGTPPYTNWVVSSGSLPGGLTLGTSTGVISGIPNNVGTFNFSVTVKDSAGATSTAQSFSIATSAAACSYAISPGGQSFAPVGGTGTITITTATGCPWSVSGLPAWVTLSSSSSGTGSGIVTFKVGPSTGGDVSGSIAIAAQNAAGVGAPGQWNLVSPGNPVWISTPAPTGLDDTRPAVAVPVRALLPNERLVPSPFGLGSATVVRSDFGETSSTNQGDGFTAADRNVLAAIFGLVSKSGS